MIGFSAVKYTEDSSNVAGTINNYHYLISYLHGFLTLCLPCGLRCKGSDAFKGLLSAFLVGFNTTTLVFMARLNGELFICCIRTRLGDTCYNRSLRFANEGASER